MSCRARAVASFVVAAGVLMVACSDDDNATPPSPVTAATTTATSTATSEPSRTTTTPPTSAALTTGSPNPTPAPPTIPPSTAPQSTEPPDEIPTVTTLVPEVAFEDLNEDQRNPRHPNNLRPYQPKHAPIIRAYLQAMQRGYKVYSTWPIDPDAPEMVGSPRTADNLNANQELLRQDLAEGRVLNVEQGVTFRPYVLMVDGAEAVLYDCEIAGHYWEYAETGEAIPPDDIWRASPGNLVEVGLRVDMVKRDGQWLMDTSQIDEGACA